MKNKYMGKEDGDKDDKDWNDDEDNNPDKDWDEEEDEWEESSKESYDDFG